MLKINKYLKLLWLGNNNIDCQSLRILTDGIAANSSLKVLYLNRNLIRDDGACYFFEMMSKNTTIETLYLDFNRISDKGCQALSKCLLFNQALNLVYMNDNDIKDIVKLSHALDSNLLVTIYIFNNHVSNEIKKLVKNKHYTWILVNSTLY